jgi:hypothetical protein
MRTELLVEAVENNIRHLRDIFKTQINDFFFTEKELHSYFYHLCISDRIFQYENHSLIHAEYPSPFKCSFLERSPYVQQEPMNTNKMRAHLDCVIVNPSFITWLTTHQKDPYGMKPLLGLGNALFQTYIELDFVRFANFNRY